MHKASDLANDERLLMERWLGRALAADETISVNAWQPHEAPTDMRREAVCREIVGQAREIGLRGADLDSDDLDALLDEAFAAARSARA